MREIHEKILGGSPISDEELEEAAEFYNDLTDKLDILGPQFSMVANEIRRLKFTVNGFAEARKRHKEREIQFGYGS